MPYAKPIATISVTSALLITAAATAANAQSGRFTMEKTDSGYVRMDTQTGAMSLCTTDGEQIICKMAADERSAFDADIAALEERVAALEAQIENGGSIVGQNTLPTEEEFERGLGYMEKFMRRFMGIAKDLENEDSRT